MSIRTIPGEFLEPVNHWRATFPDGFAESTTAIVPVLGDFIMFGSDIERAKRDKNPLRFEPVQMGIVLDGEQLTVDLSTDRDNGFSGYTVAIWKINQGFERLHGERTSNGTSIVQVSAKSGSLEPLPRGEVETNLGSFNNLIMFALGWVSLGQFLPKRPLEIVSSTPEPNLAELFRQAGEQ